MLTYDVKGRTALPIRAIPLFSPGFFGPEEVMDMLVDVESYGEAPMLKPFTVDAFGEVHGVHPMSLVYDRESVKSASCAGGSLSEMLGAMPANVMVWLDDAKAMYEFLDHQIGLQEAWSARPERMRIWFTQPVASQSVREIVLADKGHMARTSHPRTTSVVKRQRDTQGSNPKVQEVADELARNFYAEKRKWPTKKQLVSAIKEKLPDRAKSEDKTIEREFKVTWKRTA